MLRFNSSLSVLRTACLRQAGRSFATKHGYLRSPTPFHPLHRRTQKPAVVVPLARSASFSQSDSFLTASNTDYIDHMYVLWRQDPNQVHKSWDIYFQTGNYQAPPTLAAEYDAGGKPPQRQPEAHEMTSIQTIKDIARIVQMVRAFQVRGHFLADLDPLGIATSKADTKELQIENYGFTSDDLERSVDISVLEDKFQGFLGADPGRKVTIGHIYRRLKEVYCGRIGYEYMHNPNVEQCNWIRKRIETYEKIHPTTEEKRAILENLTWADHFEQFLVLKHSAAKRFGIEGGESCIPGLQALLQEASRLGVEATVMGMPHRGRLNVLANVCRKPAEQIFSEFDPKMPHGSVQGTGDVKYHLGMSITTDMGGKPMHISMLANPSHLEAVNPVVMGKTRAKQRYMNDEERKKVLGVLFHGDASFAGQGVVYETMGFANLENYETGGTVHLVVNNQIGFTTDPPQGRSSPYCTDLAKAFNVPIFHVNGDDPEAVVHVFKLAAEYRQTFKKDVVVDFVCYRKRGHNEADEPRFTQPKMYKRIGEMIPVWKKYSQQLLKEGVVTQEELTALSKRVTDHFKEKFEAAKDYKTSKHDWLASWWAGFKAPSHYSPAQKTGYDLDKLKSYGMKSIELPKGFTLHPNLEKFLIHTRKAALDSGKGIDWGLAEAMAFGSLLAEGHHVRLSGQDVERGTFSHRHAVLHDQKTFETYIPLQHLGVKQADFTVCNSSLSEYGVLGFELGYSLENPNTLVCWEAQFGDFFNTGQVIVDQFLSAGEDKWLRQSGLVVMLPHGYEGSGPEHSSARVERFLQMTNEDPDVIPEGDERDESNQIQRCNWQVLNCSTPSNHFHALRRQLHRQFRKPLILITPKSLLKLKISNLDEFGPGTKFQKIIGDTFCPSEKAAKAKRLIFCTGKVYYNLINAVEEREKKTGEKIEDLAIVRIEQLAPFPFSYVAKEAQRFPNAEIVWLQEEPKNMGAWTFIQPRLQTALFKDRGHVRPKYVGRAPSAAPATGIAAIHAEEQNKLLSEALDY